MFRSICIFIFFILSSKAFANCDFKTGEFISQLQDPSHIELIEIRVPKSAKYVKNFLKIALSPSKTIAPKLRKRFKADITVHYSFGKCILKGKIRQNGDFKDHIGFDDRGKPNRSLDINLSTGNIMSSVKFKLLLPDTRNGENEILASLLLKELGIISPDTFAVRTLINGTNSVMLFQEKAQKELLEKNYRRESALFEGDEELLWSYKDFMDFELEPLALSKMVNSSWFKKGTSS
jgi:hypothetical protein